MAVEAGESKKLQDGLQWFTLGVALLTAASVLATKMSEWVPLVLMQEEGFLYYSGWAMVIAFPLAAVGIAIAGMVTILHAFSSLLSNRMSWVATLFSGIVFSLLVLGAIAETIYDMAEEADALVEQSTSAASDARDSGKSG